MSYVYNIIILAELDDANTDTWRLKNLDLINKWLTDNHYGPLNQLDDKFGGYKACEMSVSGGAFNYLDLTKFMPFLRSLHWKLPDYVKILIKTQEDIPELVGLDYEPQV